MLTIQKPGIVLLDCGDDRCHLGSGQILELVFCGVKDAAPLVADTVVALGDFQEADILGIREICLAPENGQLILVGPAGMGAEASTVATLIAHAVDVDDLL